MFCSEKLTVLRASEHQARAGLGCYDPERIAWLLWAAAHLHRRRRGARPGCAKKPYCEPQEFSSVILKTNATK